jgi:hypothetical protein
VALPSRVISSAAVGVAEGAVAARKRPGSRDRRRGKASHPVHRGRGHRHGSRVGPARSAAGIGVQIHREATRRSRPRLPTRNPIRIGAGGAGGGVAGAVRGLAVRARVGVQAAVRGPADVSGRTEFAGIEWTSVALA